LTDSLFFDADCLSAFLWVENENLLVKLYPGRVVIPKQVYDELSHPSIPQLKARVDTLISNNQVTLVSIDTGTSAYTLYYQLTESPKKGHVIIGKGEAASIALAKDNNGIVASNNLKDINPYVEEFGLQQITTGEILMEAHEKGYITKIEGDLLWASMLTKRRKLGANSFSEYLKSKGKLS
jgi:predicted nucleic acid-binding protein